MAKIIGSRNCKACNKEFNYVNKNHIYCLELCRANNFGEKRKVGICVRCNKRDAIIAKGLCRTCYRSKGTPIVVCKRCGQLKNHHAKGYCMSCYNFEFKLTYIKGSNAERLYNIPAKDYWEITKECAACGFSQIVELHHIDEKRLNNSRNNLIGLCPNHHKMRHTEKYKEEVLELVQNRVGRMI